MDFAEFPPELEINPSFIQKAGLPYHHQQSSSSVSSSFNLPLEYTTFTETPCSSTECKGTLEHGSDLDSLLAENQELRVTLETLLKEKHDLVSYGLDQEERIGTLQDKLEKLDQDRNLTLEKLNLNLNLIRTEKDSAEEKLENHTRRISGLESSLQILTQERDDLYLVLSGKHAVVYTI